MKKILCLILTAIMVFSLVACTSNDIVNEDDLKEIQDIVNKLPDNSAEAGNPEDDDKSVSQLTNAAQLALADQMVYDAVSMYACKHNVESYVEAVNGETCSVQGDVQSVTITFQQEVLDSGKTGFNLSHGIINKFVRTDGAEYIDLDTVLFAEDRDVAEPIYLMSNPDYENRGMIGQMVSDKSNSSYFYNAIRATVGNTIEITSEEYNNSEYTIFIVWNEQGVTVAGGWNGINID